MRPPVLNREMVLEAAAPISDGAGGNIESWVALGTLWASLDARTSRETTGEAGPLSTASYRITLRAAPSGCSRRPEPGQRLRMGNRIFRILTVTEADTQGRYLRCLSLEEVAA